MSEDQSDVMNLTDTLRYVHVMRQEISRGGQGAVYRTNDPDTAVKIAIKDEEPYFDPELNASYLKIRTLPIPDGLPITLPQTVLADISKQPSGYVMRLLAGMTSLESLFKLTGAQFEELKGRPCPSWIGNSKDPNSYVRVLHYAESGGLRKRLRALMLSARVLARLHHSGIYFGDVSRNNIFVDEDMRQVYFIDADNLAVEKLRSSAGLYTPGLGAPEIMQSLDGARPRTDVWSFAVMAFQLLTLTYPFAGKMLKGNVRPPAEDANGWIDPNVTEQDDPKVLSESGYFPYIKDPEDATNAADPVLPLENVLSPELRRLFEETFCAGRVMPWRRPAMSLWARAFERAEARVEDCLGCGIGYDDKDRKQCPFCAHRTGGAS